MPPLRAASTIAAGHHEGSEMDAKFWFWILGMCILAAVAVAVVFLIIGAAWEAWGFFGAIALFFLVLIGFGWFYDRRQRRRYEELPE
jgi:Flp pilus assembly protein TadB